LSANFFGLPKREVANSPRVWGRPPSWCNSWYGPRTFEQPPSPLAVDALTNAIALRPPRGVVLHSARGRQFRSHAPPTSESRSRPVAAADGEVGLAELPAALGTGGTFAVILAPTSSRLTLTPSWCSGWTSARVTAVTVTPRPASSARSVTRSACRFRRSPGTWPTATVIPAPKYRRPDSAPEGFPRPVGDVCGYQERLSHPAGFLGRDVPIAVAVVEADLRATVVLRSTP